MPPYVTTGPRSGPCPHRHRTLGGALRCVDEHARACRRQGTTSDRQVQRADGRPLTAAEQERVYWWQHREAAPGEA